MRGCEGARVLFTLGILAPIASSNGNITTQNESGDIISLA